MYGWGHKMPSKKTQQEALRAGFMAKPLVLKRPGAIRTPSKEDPS
jgi:hypothetical protein